MKKAENSELQFGELVDQMTDENLQKMDLDKKLS